MINDRLIINGTPYTINDIPTLLPELAAYKVAKKSNDMHLVFAGDLRPYSNLHLCPFIITGQKFYSTEQWIQFQKALAFGDSYMANMILQAESPVECGMQMIKLQN